MAEIVAFEDSPLGQYLQEVDAAEALVVDDKVYNSPTTETNFRQEINFSKSVFRKLMLWTCLNSATDDLLTRVWQETIAILASSGHMAERYTPMKTHWSISNGKGHLGEEHSSESTIKRVIPLGIGSVLALCSGRLAKPRLFFCTGAIPSKLGISIGVTAGAVILLAYKAWNQFKAKKLAQSFIYQLESMAHNCRGLDSTIHNAFCFIQEVDFVQRGFRLTHQYRISITHKPGHGSLLMAQHLRHTLSSELSQLLQTQLDVLDDLVAKSIMSENLIEIANEAKEALIACSDDKENLALEALRAKFALLFSMRRIWLEHMTEIINPENRTSNQMRDEPVVLQKIIKTLQQLDKAAIESMESIKRAREGQYTANRWALLAKSDNPTSTQSQPLVRTLENMTQVLDTIEAKLIVCQECIHNATTAESTSDNVARLFTSLKSDIDMLGIHYQQSVNVLLGVGSEEHEDLGANAEAYAIEDGSDTLPENTQIFTYTPINTTDLDAPAMIFESEVNTEQSGPHSQRERPVLSRMERIRIQRQNRADEEAARQRKNDVFSMLDELKSAIDTRANESRRDPQNSERT